jgi:acetyl-CoA synthetase
MYVCFFAGRVVDCKAKAVLTCSAVMRGKKKIGLKQIVDDALELASADGNTVSSSPSKFWTAK